MTHTYAYKVTQALSKGVTHISLYLDCTYTSSWGSQLGSSITQHYHIQFFIAQMRNLMRSSEGGSWLHHPVCWGMLWARAQLLIGSVVCPCPHCASPQVQTASEGPWLKSPNKAPGISHTTRTRARMWWAGPRPWARGTFLYHLPKYARTGPALPACLLTQALRSQGCSAHPTPHPASPPVQLWYLSAG